MKKIYGVFLVFIMISFLTTSCSDSGTNPESKRMRVYASLTNGSNDTRNLKFSQGRIYVSYYPAVNQSSFILNGLKLHEDNDNAIAYDSWYYSNDQDYHWITDTMYSLTISANDDKYISNSSCEVPSEFVLSESSFSVEIDPYEDFSLSWSNCENETNFKLYYHIDTQNTSTDSLIILEKDSNYFIFTSDMLNIANATDIYIKLSAINGPLITADSNGNFTGDGNGYFYGEYSSSIELNYINSVKQSSIGIPNTKLFNEKSDKLFMKHLGF